MRRFGKIVLCFSLLGGVAAMAAGPDWETLGKRWWAHVQYLADDKLEGRNTGSEGYEKAAAYVTEQFRNAGLQPAGANGYAQSVEFNAAQLDEQHSSLELVREGKTEAVKFGDEAFITAGQDLADSAEADAVFVGYGFSVPELKYDDFAGLDLKGKIAVYVTGGPATIPNPKTAEVPWSRTAASRFMPRMSLRDQEDGDGAKLKVALVIRPEAADKFLGGSGHAVKEIFAAANADKALPHFPLAVKIRVKNSVKKWQVKSENLAGVLRGSDATLGKEYVVISAHLDHIGVGEPVNGDKIYNGAMDDASGIASLIEIARAMKESGARPKRSILFLAVTGEEKGLLGSRYFAEHPTVDAKSIVADLNMDMFLPLFALKYLEVQGLGESTLGEDIRAVCEAAGVQVQADKQPDHNRFIRSDQYSFIRKGVPALAFKFGWLPGTPEEKTFNDWYKERYHGPADDVNQPVDAAAAAQFNAILEKLALRVADAAQRPQWKADSFFRRFAQ